MTTTRCGPGHDHVMPVMFKFYSPSLHWHPGPGPSHCQYDLPVQAAMALPGDIEASEKTLTHTD